MDGVRKGHDDPHAGPTLAYGILGAVLVFVITVGLQALFNSEQRRELDRKVVSKAPEALVRLAAEQQEKLHSYRWVDAKAGVVAIPIDRAMELTIRDLNRGASLPNPSAAPAIPGGAR
jgi:hypothetical protein